MPSAPLPLRRAARQLLHFALLRSARVLTRLQGLLGFALLAPGTFQFLAFVFAQCGCICHECDWFPLDKFSAVPTGLGHSLYAYPALKRWAIIGRPSGLQEPEAECYISAKSQELTAKSRLSPT